MELEKIFALLTNVLGTSGVVVMFLRHWILGLRKEIESLKNIVTVQDEAIKVIQGSISNISAIGDVYGKFLNDLPKHIEQYKNMISKLKDERIAELEKANQLKDEKLTSLAEIKLREIEISEKMISELPKLIQQVSENVDTMQTKIKSIISVAAKQSTPLSGYKINM